MRSDAIRGFNYAPSYGSSGLELWQKFDADVIAVELSRGRSYFPGANAIRLWLSRDAFTRDESRFLDNFEKALQIADDLELRVMPVLFNRWHNDAVDFGGIYLDHFLPGTSWYQRPRMFDAFVDAVVGGHVRDARILAWDLCNEPYPYTDIRAVPESVVDAESAWLRSIYERCKELGAEAPVTVSAHQLEGVAGLERVASISDILSIHPYVLPASFPRHLRISGDRTDFRKLLDDYAAFAARVGKPLVATECCWGSLDNAERAELVQFTLAELKERGIGWMVHLLHHSLIADAHRPEFGPVGPPGVMAFIEADGTLRPGHEVFNDF